MAIGERSNNEKSTRSPLIKQREIRGDQRSERLRGDWRSAIGEAFMVISKRSGMPRDD